MPRDGLCSGDRIVSTDGQSNHFRNSYHLCQSHPTSGADTYGRLLDGVVAASIMLPGLISAVLVMRVTQPRDKRNHCRSCGYDLTGNVSGNCPECGEPI